jgi:hypothetical protein
MTRLSVNCIPALLLPALLLLGLSCAGQSRRQTEVAAAYDDFRSLLEGSETAAAYARLSNSTRSLLDDASHGLVELGLDHVTDGYILFQLLLEDSLLSSSMGEAGPVFMLNDSLAELSASGATGPVDFTLRLEEGAWKVDLEKFFELQLNRDLEGTGLDTGIIIDQGDTT